MASFLLSECLENIFSNFINKGTEIKVFTKDLHSCTLVSRHWCKISTPFLYAYPAHGFDFSSTVLPDDSYFKLIHTLLSCIPQSEIKQIYTTKYIPFNKKDSHSSFNYISFICGFILDEIILGSQNVCHYKNIWLSAHNPESISSEQIIRIMTHFVNFLFKHSNNLAMLRISYIEAPEFFQLISSFPLQKTLQHIILSPCIWYYLYILLDEPPDPDYSTVFNLLTQSENLQILEFNNVSFYKIDEKALNLLCLLKKIKELRLCYCEGIKNLIPWAKSLTKLKVFETAIDYYYPSSEEDFLIQIFQSSSNTLTKLVIDINIRSQDFTQIFQRIIPLYLLHSLRHLELPKVLPTELISILKSCIKLVYLSVMLNDDVDLKGLGEFIPKTLERIWFQLLITSFKESLRCFLEGYTSSNGALKYLEFGCNNDRVDSFITDGIQIIVHFPTHTAQN